MINRKEIIEKLETLGFLSARILNNPRDEGSIIITAFPLTSRKDWDESIVPVAPFARSNHYGEAVKRLKKASLFIREKTGLSKQDIRIFSNSTLPEKQYAASSGLGFYGRNSLIIIREGGSRIVLAGLLLPLDLPADAPLEKGDVPGALCGSCRRCQKACPTGALEQSGKVNRDKCLQSLATDDRIFDESIMVKWGNRIYGCTICQDCCPFNRHNRDLPVDDIKGPLPRNLTFRFLLSAGDDEIKKELKGTALGLSWIKPDHLRRNALISLASSVNRQELEELTDLVRSYENHPDLAYAARWLLEKTGR